MIGEMLRDSAAMMAMLSVQGPMPGHYLANEQRQDGACVQVGIFHAPPHGEPLCCVPDRRANPRLCPRA
ncbi:hypothetical protein [Sphingobium estronivorans]|uniref:hypothetical protein n=1 Tax=Sphingobium estronivorans TaxID=1577690 RepID=UPI00123A3DC1|nr:hypothetical protein [Sphingobium estronivorans]